MAGSKTNSMENNLLLLLFENTTWANIGDATGLEGSGTAGSFYISLHTASPGEAGDQTTNEISYTGYARVAVARSSAAWTVTGNQVQNDAAITFGEMTGGTGGTALYAGVGRDSGSGAGELLYYCEISDPVAGLAISNGITPEIGINGITITED